MAPHSHIPAIDGRDYPNAKGIAVKFDRVEIDDGDGRAPYQ